MYKSTVHASLSVKDSEMKFHVSFKALLDDDGQPVENVRNKAIRAVSERFPEYWPKRLSIDIYRYDGSGEEILILTVK